MAKRHRIQAVNPFRSSMLQVSVRTSSLNPLPGVITMRTNLSLVLSRAAIGALALSATPFLADAQRLTANRPVANVPSAARPISWASSAALPAARDHHVTFITSGTAGAWLYVG